MYELHENEQYFFDAATIDVLSTFLVPHAPVCCLCAPLLGKRLTENGVDVTVRDIDERFSHSPASVTSTSSVPSGKAGHSP